MGKTPGQQLLALFDGLSPAERINALYQADIIDADGRLEPDYQQALKKEVGRPGICYVLLGFGYVESALVGKHVYQLRLYENDAIKEPPKTAAEALRLLATDFLALYRDEFSKRSEDGEFDIETFQYWLYELGKADCDSMPCDGSGGFGHWWPYPSWAEILASPKGMFLDVYERAEVLLCAALDPKSFDGSLDRARIVQWQNDFLKHRNRLSTHYADIDAILEADTKRPGYGEQVC